MTAGGQDGVGGAGDQDRDSGSGGQGEVGDAEDHQGSAIQSFVLK